MNSPDRYSVVRRIQFCAGHRVMGHESKCSHLHGHNYVALVRARPRAGLDSVGRVIDFSVLKERVGGWIDRHWDHGLILCDADAPGHAAVAAFKDAGPRLADGSAFLQKLYTMPGNPTAEVMADHLLRVVCPALFTDADGIEVDRVELWETENCYAVAEL